MTASPAVALHERMTLRAALGLARAQLASSATPDLDAQALLQHVLEVDRASLFTHPEREVIPAQWQRLQDALRRREAGEPIAYISGSKGFYDGEIEVSPAVLVPRPETELLLEAALRLIDEGELAAVADIGTGSGALALTFARHRPRCQVYACDISAAALQVARRNAERQKASLTFCQGDLAEPLIQRGIKLDLLLANLPYIPSAELARLPVSHYEPRLALDGGADGLGLIRRLLAQLPGVCRPGASVLLEIGADQGAAVAELVLEALGVDCAISPDYAGLDRVASFQLG